MSRRQQHLTKPSADPTPAARAALADRPFVTEPPQQVPEAQAQPEQRPVAAGHSIAATPARVGRRTVLQPKLTLGAPNDPYEQEADRVADQVLHAPTPQQRQAPPRIQRAATASAGAEVTPEVETGISQLRGGGQPLDGGTRATMEARIGHDFSQVRVHTDARAARLSSQVRARAFTVGPDVAFAPGQYQPASPAGQRLLAHELTHVVQQGQAVIRRDPDGTTAEAPPGKEEITEGSTGDSVKEAQEKLNKHGAAPPLAVDGIFGPLTLGATRVFQTSHPPLKVDGIIGPETWGALDKLPGPIPALAPGPAPDPAAEPTEAEQIQALKIKIETTYGIDLDNQAGIKAMQEDVKEPGILGALKRLIGLGVSEQAISDKAKPKEWLLKELQNLEQSLKNYAPLLGKERGEKLGDQPITSFSRTEALAKRGEDGDLTTSPSTMGVTFPGGNISMFDQANTAGVDFDTSDQQFRGTVEHELSHGLIEDLPAEIKDKQSTMIEKYWRSLDFWSGRYVSSYWSLADGSAGTSDEYDVDKTREAAEDDGVEVPITNYGMTNAEEDLAETMMYFFEDPQKLKDDCPLRFQFILDNIKKYLDPEKVKAAEDL